MNSNKNEHFWVIVFSKKVFIVISITILTFFVGLILPNTAYKWLIFPAGFHPNLIMDIAVLLLSLFITAFFIRLKYLKYKISFLQSIVLWVLIELHLIFSYDTFGVNGDLEFINFSILLLNNYSWLGILLAPLYFLFVVNAIELCISIFEKPAPDSKKYLFSEDNPQYLTNEYVNISQVIINAVKNYRYERAFSIAILGSWGHGKTSFINSLKECIDKDFDKHELIAFDFYPFFNHGHGNIVSEFFSGLNDAISPYSGAAGTSLIQYANRLSQLYKKGEVSDFLNLNPSLDKKSAYNHYLDLKRQLSTLNKKIVIYIDDVDRLEKSEIIEVLKLIRNTSNFPNVFFIVALDCSYVTKKLGESETYLSKFFQLEFVLPERKPDELAESLVKILGDSDCQFDEDNLNKLKKEITNENSIFNVVVRNHRDVIKISNRLILEISLLKGVLNEVSIVDVFYLSVLKSRYFDFFKYICENMNDVFEREKNLMTLKSKPKTLEERVVNGVHVDLENWDLSPIFKKESFTNVDKPIKSLLWQLFLRNDELGDSVRDYRNFYKLVRLKYDDTDLLYPRFEGLLDVNSNFESEVDEIISEQKTDQLISKIFEFKSDDKKTLNRLLEIVFYLLSLDVISENLGLRLRLVIKSIFNPDNKESLFFQSEQKELFSKEVLENRRINHFQKVKEIITMITQPEYSSICGFSEEELKMEAKTVFEDFFKNNNPWDVTDDQPRNMFYWLKNILGIYVIRKLFKECLNEKNIEVFCLQNINEIEPYIFQLSPFLHELFGTYKEYEEWIKENYPATEFFKEYLRFLELTSIRNYAGIKFKFLSIDTTKRQIYGDNHQKLVENEKLVEVYVRVNGNTKVPHFEGCTTSSFYRKNIYVITSSQIDIDEFLRVQTEYIKNDFQEVLGDSPKINLYLNDPHNKRFEIFDSKGEIILETISIQYGK